MPKTQRLVGVLRVLLALAFAALLMGQLRALPAMYDDWTRNDAELTDSGWLLVVAEVELLCVQVVIVCTWQLLMMVKDDRIFSDGALVWVNVIIGAMGVGWLVLLVAFLRVATDGARPLSPVLLGLTLVAGAVFGLLMVVMRALLRQATTLRSELEAVV